MVNNNDTITLPRNVVEQALEALTNCTSEYGHRCNRCDSEVDPDGNVESALRAALDQPQVEPQVEQEPFAWISPRALEWGTRQSEKVVKLTCKAQSEYDFTEPLYTHPQPKREPLCEDEGCPHHGTAHVCIN